MKNQDLKIFAERKMTLFALIVSIWQHKTCLENTTGIGFTESVFAYRDSICILSATKSNIDAVVLNILNQIKKNNKPFTAWYEKAKRLNTKADELLLKHIDDKVKLDIHSYNEVMEILNENLGYCTILPFWVLYAINTSLENGENREVFGKTLEMYEELKKETRYPQIVKNVISKYLDAAIKTLNISEELAECIHPEELRKIINGEKSVDKTELERRAKWCAMTLDKNPLLVKFDYTTDNYPSLLSEKIDKDIKEIRGNVAFAGTARGRVKVVNSIDDMKKFNEGDILVSFQSSPAIMPAIVKCSALITDEGGIMCHASIISRELKKPCVIGTKIATKVLKDGDMVEVDANNGIIKIINN
ncbi:MAG: PEP-utilizing enzyme [Candidatus Paceibacterota bacterium]|jgi:phosphohistidine swiveling domain-containing protein